MTDDLCGFGMDDLLDDEDDYGCDDITTSTIEVDARHPIERTEAVKPEISFTGDTNSGTFIINEVVLNPNWRWWTFWRPKTILSSKIGFTNNG